MIFFNVIPQKKKNYFNVYRINLTLNFHEVISNLILNLYFNYALTRTFKYKKIKL